MERLLYLAPTIDSMCIFIYIDGSYIVYTVDLQTLATCGTVRLLWYRTVAIISAEKNHRKYPLPNMVFFRVFFVDTHFENWCLLIP